MKPLYIFVLFTLLLTSCTSKKSTPSANIIQTAIAETQLAQSARQRQVESPIPNTQEVITPAPQQLPATNIPSTSTVFSSNKLITLIPYNYQMNDVGGGWNSGRVNIAIANMTNEIIRFKYIIFSGIIIETKEGQTYNAQIDMTSTVGWEYAGGLSALTDNTLGYESLIIPGTQFSKLVASVPPLEYSISWRSATAATPIKVVFNDFPDLSFNLPNEKGGELSFPFITTPISIQSVDALKGVKIQLDNEKIEANFTGMCHKQESTSYSNLYLIEFSIKNEDAFQESTFTSLGINSVMYLENGGYGYYNDPIYPESRENIHRLSNNQGFIIGPGQNAITFIIGGEIRGGRDEYSGKVYSALIWPDGSYSFYDLTSCPQK